MEELYLETNNGNILIDQNIAKKLNLKKGTMSPFTNNRIVGKNGEYISETVTDKDTEKHGLDGKEDGIVEMEDGFMVSTSEIIDISHGTDSSTK